MGEGIANFLSFWGLVNGYLIVFCVEGVAGLAR